MVLMPTYILYMYNGFHQQAEANSATFKLPCLPLWTQVYYENNWVSIKIRCSFTEFSEKSKKENAHLRVFPGTKVLRLLGASTLR